MMHSEYNFVVPECVLGNVSNDHFVMCYLTSNSLLVFIAGHAEMLLDVLVIMTCGLDSNLTLIFEWMSANDPLTVISDVLSFSFCPDVVFVCPSSALVTTEQGVSLSVMRLASCLDVCWPASSYLHLFFFFFFFYRCSLQTVQKKRFRSSVYRLREF